LSASGIDSIWAWILGLLRMFASFMLLAYNLTDVENLSILHRQIPNEIKNT